MKFGFRLGAMMTVASISLFTVTLGNAQPAEATLKICNRTNSRVSTAIAHVIQGGWRSQGWWGLNPGECKTVFSGSAENREFHFHAHNQAGDKVWEGNQAHCVSNRAFTIDSTFNSPRCDLLKKFRKLAIVSKTNSTVNLH